MFRGRDLAYRHGHKVHRQPQGKGIPFSSLGYIFRLFGRPIYIGMACRKTA